MSDDLKARIMEAMETSSSKGKKKLYIKDLAKKIEGVTKKDVQNVVKDLIAEGKLAYWSSGSTTYVMTKKDFDAIQNNE